MGRVVKENALKRAGTGESQRHGNLRTWSLSRLSEEK